MKPRSVDEWKVVLDLVDAFLKQLREADSEERARMLTRLSTPAAAWNVNDKARDLLVTALEWLRETEPYSSDDLDKWSERLQRLSLPAPPRAEANKEQM
jgi:hypothetical protein